MVPGELRGGAPAYLAHASFAAITARDRDGRLWTSPLVGPPGFMAATTSTRLSLRNTLPIGDPLYGLPESQPVGIVVMEFAAKRRIRIDGTWRNQQRNAPSGRHPGIRQLPAVHSSAADQRGKRCCCKRFPRRARRFPRCRRHRADSFGGYLLLGHLSSRARQRRVASRKAGGIRARRPQQPRLAGLPGQQHVQQFRQSRDRPDRRTAVHRLRERANTSSCRAGRLWTGRSRPAGRDTGRWVRFTAECVVS